MRMRTTHHGLEPLAEVRHRATREGWCYPHVQAIIVAIDQYAEAVLGSREFFLSRPYGAAEPSKLPDFMCNLYVRCSSSSPKVEQHTTQKRKRRCCQRRSGPAAIINRDIAVSAAHRRRYGATARAYASSTSTRKTAARFCMEDRCFVRAW